MRSFPEIFLISTLLTGVCGIPALAQTAGYGIGRVATPPEIEAWDISISPDGSELPAGSGTARDGAVLYAKRCASCHGRTGAEAPAGPRVVGDRATLTTLQPQKSVGSYWPFATQIWDFINRAMPPNFFNRPVPSDQKLTPDQVYAVTAFLLYQNGIIKETDVIDANTLPKIQMPNRNGFVPQRLEDILDYRGRRRCRSGTCP